MDSCSDIKCKVYDAPNNVILPFVFKALEDVGVIVKQVKSDHTQIIGEILYRTNQRDVIYVIVAPLCEIDDYKEKTYLVVISLTIDTNHDIGRNKTNLNVFYKEVDRLYDLLSTKKSLLSRI